MAIVFITGRHRQEEWGKESRQHQEGMPMDTTFVYACLVCCFFGVVLSIVYYALVILPLDRTLCGSAYICLFIMVIIFTTGRHQQEACCEEHQECGQSCQGLKDRRQESRQSRKESKCQGQAGQGGGQNSCCQGQESQGGGPKSQGSSGESKDSCCQKGRRRRCQKGKLMPTW